MNIPAPVLSVRGLATVIHGREGERTVVEDVSFDLAPGRSLAVVGESGAGKSMLIRSLLGLHAPGVDARVSGSALIAGVDMVSAGDRARRRVLRESVGMIHQDPLRSLNPTYRVGTQLTESLTFRKNPPPRSRLRARAIAAMSAVGFRDPERESRRFPHELSGGQRQRIGIAAATLNEPALLIGDEPTTALDVTVQKRVLDLIDEMRARTGASLLLITHDLGVAAERCDDLIVMRAGRVVEAGPAARLLTHPAHPYTRSLIDAIPRLDGPRPRRLRTPSEGTQS
ncbi:ABC transporter ATP-binding protein [Mycetocola spongiae]|uniref:ABC transporter ATP-binding protein n=1 Tax=Mycetocola spongiae TaxID=2859226 RepID=UPI001CF47C1F|nr:ABC transporter ATP-binding protein [Mycetocola spongiae]UCR89459.1 ABC transporter ATP-binding protein [Mycetocola spongiae]